MIGAIIILKNDTQKLLVLDKIFKYNQTMYIVQEYDETKRVQEAKEVRIIDPMKVLKVITKH